MTIITSKTDQAIRNEFNRRRFLRLAGSAGFGITVYSSLGKVSLAVLPPGVEIPAGYFGFWDNFKNFALNLGMQFAGYQLNQAFNRYPSLQTGFNNFMQGVNGYNPLQNWEMITGLGRTFVPIQNQGNLFMSPFFNTANGALGSPMSWWTTLAAPQVNTVLEDQLNLSQNSRAGYLLPTTSRRHGYNDSALPERYNTVPGSTEFAFKGAEKSGDVDYKIYVKRRSGTLEELKESGTLGVEIQA